MQAAKKHPRPYQVEAGKAILATWAKHRSHLCIVATGGGKTFIAASTTGDVLRKDAKHRVLFLANRNELCTQPLAAFAGELGFEPALEKAEARASLDAAVVVGSVQTLARQKRLERFPKDHFSHIWCDEAHMSVAESWRRILEHFSGAKVCGITATPFRSDAKVLTEVYEAESFRKGLFDLVDEGWLVDPDHVFKLESAISLAQVRVRQTTEGKDYDLQDAADAIAPYFAEIARELKAKHAGRKILAFLPLVASSQKFVEACVKEGINAVHVDGNDPERDIKLAAFRDGKISLLANSNLLHTGVDIPVCDCTLNLRPTKSKVLYQQIVGRSTRTLTGVIEGLDTIEERKRAIAASAKPKAYILDPLWLSSDHDLVTPSFLIAKDEEFAAEMNKVAGKSYSLRAVARRVQEEREAAIRRRLDAAAHFREGRIQADWFAAQIEDHELVNYEPVYGWELHAPGKFTSVLLQQAGIDPASVKTEGLARQVLRAIGRRRNKKLPEIRALAAVAESEGITPRLWTLTGEQLQLIKYESPGH
jgi:superfamily II DNA or RNA helicase